jgi:hypothetical protein
MAMKDWMRMRKVGGRWETKSLKNYDQIDVNERRPNRYSVVSIYGRFRSRWFGSRTNALKFAKDYMRRN